MLVSFQSLRVLKESLHFEGLGQMLNPMRLDLPENSLSAFLVAGICEIILVIYLPTMPTMLPGLCALLNEVRGPHFLMLALKLPELFVETTHLDLHRLIAEGTAINHRRASLRKFLYLEEMLYGGNNWLAHSRTC
jgi:hypothetical protein